MNYYVCHHPADTRKADLKREILSNLTAMVTDPTQADLILVLGGDGTMLDAIHKFHQHNKPFFGVNCGTLGFLANDVSSSKDIPTSLDNLEVITEPLLKATTYCRNGEILHNQYAVNEFALSSMTPGTTPRNTFTIKQGNQTSGAIVGDKLIIASSIGSTGTWLQYNKNMPLIEHGIDTIGIQGVGTNPFVYEFVDGDKEISIDIASRHKHMIEIDCSHKKITDIQKVIINYAEQLYQLCFLKEGNKELFSKKRRMLYQQKTNSHRVLFPSKTYD